MSVAYACEACSGFPHWRLTRRGDVVVTWACDDDLASVLHRLQRRGREDEIVVRRATDADLLAWEGEMQS